MCSVLSKNFKFKIMFLLCLLYAKTDSNCVNIGGFTIHFPHIDISGCKLEPQEIQ